MNFRQIIELIAELATHEWLTIYIYPPFHVFFFIISFLKLQITRDCIIIILFQFRPDLTADNIVALEHVCTPLFSYNGGNDVSDFLGCLLTYWRNIQNILMTILAGSLVSDRCPLGFLSAYSM